MFATSLRSVAVETIRTLHIAQVCQETRPEVFRAVRSSGKGLPSRREVAILSPPMSQCLFLGLGAPLRASLFIASCCILLPQHTASAQGYPPLPDTTERPLALGSDVALSSTQRAALLKPCEPQVVLLSNKNIVPSLFCSLF